MIVYKIKNKIDGKVYIGQTIQTLKMRWYNHCRRESLCRYLKHAIEKYGKENFEISILAHCSSLEEMNHREKYYISLFETMVPNGYNLTSGGKNKVVSEETKLKQSQGLKEGWKNRKNQKPTLGLKRSEASKIKTANTLRGVKHSIERCLNQSIARKKLFESGYINPSKSRKGKPNSGSFGYGRVPQKGGVSPIKGRKRVIIEGQIRYLKQETL